MIRLATEDDLLWLAQQIFALRTQTTWKCFEIPEFTVANLVEFVLDKLDDPESIIYIDGLAFCGGSLERAKLPPFWPAISEWAWGGPKKEAVGCLQAVFAWGKEHGAMFGGYVLAKPGHSTQFVEETLVWRKL